MSQSIENILTIPNQKKAAEYATTISVMKGYGSLINTIAGGGNKQNDSSKKNILNHHQITIAGEERETNRAKKRK